MRLSSAAARRFALGLILSSAWCAAVAQSDVVAQSDAVDVRNFPVPQIDAPLLIAATPATESSSADSLPESPSALLFGDPQQAQQTPTTPKHKSNSLTCEGCDVDANGNPIPLERQQPKRILGFMPNFRSVSAGAKPHPLGWKYNFSIATKQAFDYSSFLFLGLTSITAEGMDSHPALGKGVPGFWAYTWRGFLDKTDGTYLSAWLLPSLLHEDTRYHPLGAGHSVVVRSLYVISRQGVAQTYGGRQTPNIAGLGGKVLTQVISRTYYPSSAATFSTLATKFGYSVMRDVAFSSIREFFPDIQAHYVRKHREKAAAQAERDAHAAGVPTSSKF
ncbi:hypothetical protein ACFQBQ_07100 [Granulicella cerasi]|uniref:Uncharacterized protein n=1 Tax=Granulicella cerasi TaxID=741063 RepID=A0ABW1Z9H6_9BACT|nr:hypothetical protein [Granulicella cerasi]